MKLSGIFWAKIHPYLKEVFVIMCFDMAYTDLYARKKRKETIRIVGVYTIDKTQ
jgi:hypothetical protein